MNMDFAQFNMDTGCVETWLMNEATLSIDRTAFERIEGKKQYS